MTERDKAKELMNKIIDGLFRDRGTEIYQEDVSYISSIIIESIINDSKDVYTSGETDIDEFRNYWVKVKNELENY
jgi:hypothetical protein